MRIGMNPQKQEQKIELKYHHRLIIVVYIPQKEEYYQNIFSVFKLCLESAIVTINKTSAITVVNNGSHSGVVNYINEKFEKNEIDSVIHHKENIGKMDAIVGAARASREQLITFSDVDILFKIGWQQEVEKVFKKFKNVGSVSPISVKSTYRYANSSTLEKIIFKKIKFYLNPIPENHKDYSLYLSSINWKLKNKINSNWPIVVSNSHKAIIGSAHQVLTIDRNVIMNNIPQKPSLALIGRNSVFDYCDNPIDISGGLRLCTFNNFAYHMGNTIEDWMLDIQKENINIKNIQLQEITDLKLNFTPRKKSGYLFKLKQKFIYKIFDLLYAKEINETI